MSREIHIDEVAATEPSEIQIETLSGDIRDVFLQTFKDRQRPWSILQEEEQRGLANELEYLSKDIIKRCVRLLSNHDFPRVVVQMGDLKIAGGDKAILEAKVTAINMAENRDVLCELPGRSVILLCVDSEDFMGERNGVKIDADQPDMLKPDPKEKPFKAKPEPKPVAEAEPDHDPDTGEVNEASTAEDSAPEDEPPTPKPRTAAEQAAADEARFEEDGKWLAIMAKLKDGESANVPNTVAARLANSGFLTVKHEKKGGNPARYAITPAGRSAIEED